MSYRYTVSRTARYRNGERPYTDPRLFAWTGEYRPPRKGEWFLSGGIVEAFLAHEDMTDARHIAISVQERRIADRRRGSA